MRRNVGQKVQLARHTVYKAGLSGWHIDRLGITFQLSITYNSYWPAMNRRVRLFVARGPMDPEIERRRRGLKALPGLIDEAEVHLMSLATLSGAWGLPN